jgi:dienelactone hydrolase
MVDVLPGDRSVRYERGSGCHTPEDLGPITTGRTPSFRGCGEDAYDRCIVEVLFFHHALGLTAGCRSLADRWRGAGHRVHTPDLYDGRTFDDLSEGVAYAQSIGFGTIAERGRAAAEDLPPRLVCAGCSLGVVPAQMLAQTRPGAIGALLFSACIPFSELSPSWPRHLPVEIHAMDGDPFFVDEGDIDAARALVATAARATLHLYPGSGHLFLEEGSPDYDATAAELATTRVLRFLDGFG